MEEPSGELTDRFLRHVAAAFGQRQTSIRHRALETEFEYSADPEMIWISSRVNLGGHRVTFAATLGNRAYIEIISGRPRSRGKVLLRQHDLRLVDAAAEIVETFEWTLSAIAGVELAAQKRAIEAIGERWRKLGLVALR